MELNEVYNMDCMELMQQMDEHCIDVVLTSPPYNTNKKGSTRITTDMPNVKKGGFTYARYDGYSDRMSNDEYCEFVSKCFNGFDRVLKENGVILWNASYGNENANALFLSLNRIIGDGFTIADVITWKKPRAMPNNQSSNKATRVCELVFVICRHSEFKTFKSNKQVSSVRPTGQKMYSPFDNYIEAPNNDGVNDMNKAAFSTELVTKLLTLYAPPGSIILDPFMGTGTTAVGAIKMGMQYIGSEISSAQVEYARARICAANKTNAVQSVE